MKGTVGLIYTYFVNASEKTSFNYLFIFCLFVLFFSSLHFRIYLNFIYFGEEEEKNIFHM